MSHLDIKITTGFTVEFVVNSEPQFYPFLREIGKALYRMGYVSSSLKNLLMKKNREIKDVFVIPEITKYLEVKDGKLIINRFWQTHICNSQGVVKSDFYNLELMVYNLYMEYRAGRFSVDITVDGKKITPRVGDGIKTSDDIYKSMTDAKDRYIIKPMRKGCHIVQHKVPGKIYPCCVCGPVELGVL